MISSVAASLLVFLGFSAMVSCQSILSNIPVVGSVLGGLPGLPGLSGVGHGSGSVGNIPSGYYSPVPAGVYYQQGSHTGYVNVHQEGFSEFLFSGVGSELSCTACSLNQIINYHSLSGLCEFDLPNVAISNIQLNALDALSLHAETATFSAVFKDFCFSGTIKISVSADVLPVLGSLGLGSLLAAQVDLVIPLNLSLLNQGIIPDFGCQLPH